MKNLLILLIKIYWWGIPPAKRRKCIFRTSCSKYVYEKTIHDGFISGLKAFRYRFQNCRSGAHLIENPSGEIQIILPNQQILNEIEISERFITNKK
ncbi:membrane protein insertion efficiency factor YidD [Chryseobacterium viscerum]|uniref:Membrane protein insertion efficiency factor YidD n=1 Tax=Chryseobacterium viscerum TaxID=1037377 RepID=A0A316X032_9FLAO|nr:membrane protein insertion efficiency factor YidD [Chryseobacterium viscerum]PWN65813.1 membrane protein insertion efficiency factor YidD [Chryseobacterium viscerum]